MRIIVLREEKNLVHNVAGTTRKNKKEPTIKKTDYSLLKQAKSKQAPYPMETNILMQTL